MINPLEITYYARTGYNPSDEPASDSVIELNEHWVSPLDIKEFDPARLQSIRVKLTNEELLIIDYLKIRDTVTGERWYYYVLGHKRYNISVVELGIAIDNFASVGLLNITFYGNISRRSLSASEKASYPLLPEPWAPKRPLKVRRLILDLNVNKSVIIPSHISTTFEESSSSVADTRTINVPNDPLNVSSFTDSLSFNTTLQMGYPNAAPDTTHTITTPWGNLTYTTPYESYYTLSGTALTTFLEKAKKYNSLDLISSPYYVSNPTRSQTITLPEISNSNIKNLKASKYYTTVTIRSLASGEAQTYSDNDTNMQYSQPLTVVIVPDKTGGMYLMPTTLRDTGLNAYTYLNGVFSPFETVTYNAIGDTPAKFASDGTINLTTALNNLYLTYVGKVNALQMEGMQTKYFKELGSVKSMVTSFVTNLLATVTNTTTTSEGHYQNTTTVTNMPAMTQSSTQTQTMPSLTQAQSSTSTTGAYDTKTTSFANTGYITTRQNSSSNNPSRTQTQSAYNYNQYNNGAVNMPSISTSIPAFTVTTNSTSNQDPSTTSTNAYTNIPAMTQTSTGSTTTPSYVINSNSSIVSQAYTQNSNQSTYIPGQTSTSVSTQSAASSSVSDGVAQAVSGIVHVFETSFETLKNILFRGYRNEMHAFMLGNINDYLNRWVSIQNDMHNGKVANLFKNITLVGGHSDRNKLAGKYEILITSLQVEDEMNFDLFLEHFGHSVDEYSNTLINDVNSNYNYTMVGEDAVLGNSVKQDASAIILNQFRTGVRVWKKLVRPENY